jgi:hypothetical protein
MLVQSEGQLFVGIPAIMIDPLLPGTIDQPFTTAEAATQPAFIGEVGAA